jgi:hypothetical protein
MVNPSRASISDFMWVMSEAGYLGYRPVVRRARHQSNMVAIR